MALRFELHIVDTETDETLVEDWTTITSIDEFGGCEAVDHSVARALRYVRRKERAEKATA